MNSEIANKWADALESGKYRQIHGKLKDPKGYCCLGVLADLQHPEGWKVLEDEAGPIVATTFAYQNDMEDARSGSLPTAFQNTVGLAGSACEKLVELNDSKHWDFHQIAEYIRANKERL